MKRKRSSGISGSSGTYPAPAAITPSMPATTRAPRETHRPTSASGPPCALSARAMHDAAAASSA
ncbi:hypothetical protein BG57_10990 [Caballeronia grimmiae]|uniref:Uncharacterized protein n=1 Tax=Caballeronia grimmiae TaxID=1071679 RepID=A0A069PI59_9BURK|nr:hypothetical protein BG57_10990 [Caballeronia grimmiae]